MGKNNFTDVKIKFFTMVIIVIIITILIINIVIYSKLNLYFSDRYLWYVQMGYKHYDISIDVRAAKESRILEYANKAIQLDPKRPEAHKLSVEYYYLWVHFNDTKTLLPQLKEELVILKDMNESSFYYKTMGRIMREQNMLNESLFYFKKAIEEDPFFVDNNVGLGLVYLKLGDTENAFKYLNQSKSLVESTYPNQPIKKRFNLVAIHTGLGFIYQEKRLYQKAEMEFEIAKSINLKDFNRISDLISY